MILIGLYVYAFTDEKEPVTVILYNFHNKFKNEICNEMANEVS